MESCSASLVNNTLTNQAVGHAADIFGRGCARLQTRAIRAAALAVALLLLSAINLFPMTAEAKKSFNVQQPLLASGSANPTAGWTNFCLRYPTECAVDPTEPAVISLSAAVWKTLGSINAQVNASVKPMSDRDHWGVEDRWDFAEDGYGDCEDYQIIKRRLLVQAGLPRRAMRMTVVIDEEGEGHAVLMIRTDGGDLILDNKRNAVLPWNRTGYVFVKREGSEGSSWASLGGRTSPTMTANR